MILSISELSASALQWFSSYIHVMDVMLDIIMLLGVMDVILCHRRQHFMAERLSHNIQFIHLISDLYISLISR